MNKKLGNMLKAIICILGILGIGMYGFVIPWSLSTFVECYPKFSYYYLPWLVFLIVSAVPLYAILAFGLKVSGEMRRDKTFTDSNVKSLKAVSFCLKIEAIYFFLGNIAFLVFDINRIGVLVASTVLCIFVFCISIAVDILTQLINKAVEMREENESII